MSRERGKVKWFDERRGYGFIERKAGEDAFVHVSDVEGHGYQVLQDGEEVEFEVVADERGPRARNVERLGPPPEPTIRQGRVRTLSASRARMRAVKRRLAGENEESNEEENGEELEG